MSKRHSEAVAIQNGACNPSGIARALVQACDECIQEGVVQSEDAAVRLITHQLAYICKTEELNDSLTKWRTAHEECEAKSV